MAQDLPRGIDLQRAEGRECGHDDEREQHKPPAKGRPCEREAFVFCGADAPCDKIEQKLRQNGQQARSRPRQDAERQRDKQQAIQQAFPPSPLCFRRIEQEQDRGGRSDQKIAEKIGVAEKRRVAAVSHRRAEKKGGDQDKNKRRACSFGKGEDAALRAEGKKAQIQKRQADREKHPDGKIRQNAENQGVDQKAEADPKDQKRGKRAKPKPGESALFIGQQRDQAGEEHPSHDRKAILQAFRQKQPEQSKQKHDSPDDLQEEGPVFSAQGFVSGRNGREDPVQATAHFMHIRITPRPWGKPVPRAGQTPFCSCSRKRNAALFRSMSLR